MPVRGEILFSHINLPRSGERQIAGAACGRSRRFHRLALRLGEQDVRPGQDVPLRGVRRADERVVVDAFAQAAGLVPRLSSLERRLASCRAAFSRSLGLRKRVVASAPAFASIHSNEAVDLYSVGR